MRQFLAVAGALGDESRVRALAALRAGELCVCQIVELLGLAPSTVSKHLFILKSAGLVDALKQGRWMYYRLAGDDAPAEAREALRWLGACVDRDAATPAVAADRRRLREILQCDPEALCDRQAKPAKAGAAAKPAGPGNSKCCSSAPATPAAVRWPRGGRKSSKATSSKPTRRASTRTA